MILVELSLEQAIKAACAKGKMAYLRYLKTSSIGNSGRKTSNCGLIDEVLFDSPLTYVAHAKIVRSSGELVDIKAGHGTRLKRCGDG